MNSNSTRSFGDLSNELLNLQLDMNLSKPPVYIKLKKSDANAEEFIKEGDAFLNRNHLKCAIECYSRALRLCIPLSRTFGISLKRRGIALQKLKLYSQALLDYKHAMKILKLKNDQLEIKNLIQTIWNLYPQTYEKENLTIVMNEFDPFVLENNNEIPCCSNTMRLCYNSEYGRHYRATKSISSGDILLVEKPFFFFLERTKELSYCHYCMRETMVLIPCAKCTTAMYCTEICMKKAFEEYHEMECLLSDCLETIRPLLKFVMIITKQGKNINYVLKLINEIENSQDKRTRGFIDNQFISNSVEAVMSIDCKIDQSILTELIVDTSLLTNLLRLHTDFMIVHDYKEMGQFILKLCTILRINEAYLRDKDMFDFLALALYPACSFINHSCIPNAISYSTMNGDRVLRAVKAIKPGEQIFSNELGDSIVFINNRQDFLHSTKQFFCKCKACLINYRFKSEFDKKLIIPIFTERKLQKNPIDIKAMWSILKCMYDQINTPSMEIEMMKYCIMEAYLEHEHKFLLSLYKKLRIL